MISIRQQLIDYISPETGLFKTEFGLLFGSRHAQPELAAEAGRLFRQRYFERIIVSGGSTKGIDVPEAHQIGDLLRNEGIPRSRIILETSASNTGENIEFSRRLELGSVNELFLLGKIYGKRRYAMTVRAKWPEICRVACVGINYFDVPRERWWLNADLRQRVIGELRKMPRYLEKGYIREIEVRDGAFLLHHPV